MGHMDATVYVGSNVVSIYDLEVENVENYLASMSNPSSQIRLDLQLMSTCYNGRA